MINATLKWMVTYWQEGFKKMWILAVYHPGDKKSTVINIQGLAFEALHHSHPIYSFSV